MAEQVIGRHADVVPGEESEPHQPEVALVRHVGRIDLQRDRAWAEGAGRLDRAVGIGQPRSRA